MRNNSAECFIGNADGVFRAREIRRLEPQDRWDTEAINSVIGAPWRRTDGKWTLDRPGVRVDPIPIPPLPFEGARIQRERITKQDIDEFGATIGCPGCNAVKDNKRNRISRTRTERNPIEPEANPKRRLLMKSASLTASGSGQLRQKRSIPDDESGMQVEDTPETSTGEGTASPTAPSANIRPRIAVKSEPVAVTTQEAVDGHCEKAMRIASVEQIELGNIMELSITCLVLRWARQSNLFV